MHRSITNDEFTLYGYWQSSSTHRVRCALNLKNIKYNKHIVSVINNDNNTDPEYIKINTMKSVPSLQHQYIDYNGIKHNNIITQSVAIIEYLDEIQPDINPLLSVDPYTNSLIRTLVHIIACDIQPLHNSRINQQITQLTSASQALQFAQNAINRGLTAIESILQRTSGVYCISNTLTMADIYLVGCMGSALRYNIDLLQYPICSRINAELHTLDEFHEAHPFNQSDYMQQS